MKKKSQTDTIVEELNGVLEERDARYPLREDQNTERMHGLMDQLIDRIDPESGTLVRDTDPLQRSETIMAYPVFLCGYMKSGTTLLLGLLDGHEELVVMPGDSYLTNKFTRKPGQPVNYEWSEWRRNWLKRMINATGQKPFWLFGTDLQPYADFLGYMDHWHEQLPEDRIRPVLSVVLSFYCANPKRPSSPRMWVDKTPGNEFRAMAIRNLFPNAKFIHIVRDPKENLASLKRLYNSRCWDWNYKKMAEILGQSCKKAVSNRNAIGDSDYLVVRYEELTADTITSMRSIAGFLGVSWQESLLEPTMNSLPAQANTMYAEREIIGKVHHSQKKRWHEVLDAKEKRAIGAILPEARGVGYSWEWSLPDRLYRIIQRLRLWS